MSDAKQKIYRIRYSGSEELHDGNSPTWLWEGPWPGNRIFDSTQCAEFSAAFCESYRQGSSTRKGPLTADVDLMEFGIHSVAVNGSSSGGGRSEMVFSVDFAVKLARAVDFADLAWLCKEAASWMVPDGGWSVAPVEIDFEYQELAAMGAEPGSVWRDGRKMPKQNRGTKDEWFAAIVKDDATLVKRMIKAGFDPLATPGDGGPRFDSRYQSFDQPNGLWHAAKAGSVNCLRELLDAGLDPKGDYYGQSTLMAAKDAGPNGGEVVRMLLAAAGDGAAELLDRRWRYKSRWSDRVDGGGASAAMLAAESKDGLAALMALLAAGADIDRPDDEGKTIEARSRGAGSLDAIGMVRSTREAADLQRSVAKGKIRSVKRGL